MMSAPTTKDRSFIVGEKKLAFFCDFECEPNPSGMSSESPMKRNVPPPISRMKDTSAELSSPRNASTTTTPRTAERAEMKLNTNA